MKFINLKFNLWWPYIVLCACLTVLCYFILLNAEWLLGDDYIMMMHSGMGKEFSMGYVIQKAAGRFFPTSYFPWQFLPMFFDGYISAGVHLGVKALMLCALALIMYNLFKEITGDVKYASLISLVATVVITARVYEDCLYLFSTSPTGFLSVAFSIWMCYRFYTKKSLVYEILALLGINFFIYASEVNFIFPLAFSFFVLLHGWKRLAGKDRIFWLVVLFSGVLYLILYYFVVFRFTTKAYDSSHGSLDSPLVNAFKMFYAQKVFWVGLAVLLVRGIKAVKGRIEYDLFFDSLLLAGFAFILGLFILRLNLTSYYYTPLVIMLPSIIYFAVKSVNSRWVLLCSLMFLALYSYRIPDKIEKAQSARYHERIVMDDIVGLYDAGHNFIWFWPGDAPKGEDEHNRIYMQTFIRYETHDEDFDFSYSRDYGLYDELGPNDIVVYSMFGDRFVKRPQFFENMKVLVDTGEILYLQKK